jgi:Domain of unknown function (DUF4439)
MTTSSPAAASPIVAALQSAADAENAAIYGYSLAGAKLATDQRALARGDYDIHRAQLLVVSGWLSERATTAGPAQPAYQLPYPITDAATAAKLLADLEEAAAGAYADVVAASSGSLQRSAGLALQSAAVREARWRGSTVAFPGLNGRSPS